MYVAVSSWLDEAMPSKEQAEAPPRDAQRIERLFLEHLHRMHTEPRRHALCQVCAMGLPRLELTLLWLDRSPLRRF
jgi:hypothetical protein